MVGRSIQVIHTSNCLHYFWLSLTKDVFSFEEAVLSVFRIFITISILITLYKFTNILFEEQSCQHIIKFHRAQNSNVTHSFDNT